MREVEVVTATVDIDEVVSYRGSISSLQEQASGHQPHPHIEVDFRICHSQAQSLIPSSPIEPCYHSPEEEISLGETIISAALQGKRGGISGEKQTAWTGFVTRATRSSEVFGYAARAKAAEAHMRSVMSVSGLKPLC